MQRFLRLCLGLTMVLYLLLPAGAHASGCSKTMMLGWTEIPPSFYSEDGSLTGIDVDILRAVFADAGCKFDIQAMPHKRYIMSLKAGDGVDMVLSASATDERRRYAYFSVPYRRERMMLFMTPAERRLLAVETLEGAAEKGAIVTAGLGMWVGPTFAGLYDRDLAFRARTLLIEGYPAMLKALVAGRADVLVGDSNAVPYQIRAMGLDGQVVELPTVVHDNEVHFMFSKKTVPLADVKRIDRALIGFVGTPAHLAILRKYTTDDPEELLPRTARSR